MDYYMVFLDEQHKISLILQKNFEFKSGNEEGYITPKS